VTAIAALAAVLGLAAGPAQAAVVTGTVDFDQFTIPPGGLFLSMGSSFTVSDVGGTGVDVTFTGTDLRIRDLSLLGLPGTTYPPGDLVLSGNPDSTAIRITFSPGFVASAVSITNIHSSARLFTQEEDDIVGTAFPTLDEQQPPCAQSTSKSTTHSLACSAIQLVIYDDTGTGFVLDDLTFTGEFERPIEASQPAALFLVGAGLLGTIAALRRRGSGV
jgi:hypothetical protein